MGIAGDWVFLRSRRQEIIDFGGTTKLRTGGVSYQEVNRASSNHFQDTIYPMVC